MRRFQALLIAAGLAAAPLGAAAGPFPADPWTQAQTYERFEWSTSKGRLGVMVMGLTPELREHLGASEDRGVLVARVEAGTPAAAAKGEEVAVDVIRDGKPLALKATLNNDPATPDRPWAAFPWLRSFFAPFESRTLGQRT